MKNSIFTKNITATFAALVALAAFAAVLSACSHNDVAGTDEQDNSFADKYSSSSSIGDNDIIDTIDSTVYIYTDIVTTQENLEETRLLIFGNDSLLPRVGSGDSMAVYRNLIQTDSIGPLYYGLNDQFDKFVFCNRAFYDKEKIYPFKNYSTYRSADTVIKSIETIDTSILESFEKECIAESGTYKLEHNIDCKFQNKEIQDCEVDGATCTISNVDSVYFDPTWEKFSSLLIDMCNGPTLDSIQRRNLAEVRSGYTLRNFKVDSLATYHSSETLFFKNHLTYSYQSYTQSASCSDNKYDIILSYNIYIQDRVSPGYIRKTIDYGSKELLDEFKEDCEKENGSYFKDIFFTCQIPLEPIETIDSVEHYQYTDPNWGKYTQKVIDHCNDSQSAK